ncbi:MAG: DNA-3-methyladenine glycosylase 2 family protein [Patescibacteria group bacterium]|nr:DNA-3-methyladenine glycosylase 2 family protein [Patescibacteria group bacterium]
MTKKIIIKKNKLRKLEPSNNFFASLVRSIIYQQLSGKAAASIEKKFFGLFYPEVFNLTNKRGTLLGNKFPKPKDVLELSDSKFKSAGVSTQKMNYLRDLSAKFLDGTINPKNFHKMTDSEIEEHLVKVKGIGIWTAHMFLIFALNRPDILPTGDLAIRKGFMKAFNLRNVPSHDKMVALAKPYAGRRTYLSLYLWGIMDDEK